MAFIRSALTVAALAVGGYAGLAFQGARDVVRWLWWHCGGYNAWVVSEDWS